MAEAAVRLTFPARTEYLLLARLAVAGVARALRLDHRDVADLELAVTEACGNAMRHAYPVEGGGEVELDLVPGADRLDLVVSDHGTGIELPVPEQPIDPTESGGMGLAIMRALVDELEIGPGPDGSGTVVHMSKRARPRDASDARARGRDSSQV
jgi:serine/threonine-protein kinase RsbW